MLSSRHRLARWPRYHENNTNNRSFKNVHVVVAIHHQQVWSVDHHNVVRRPWLTTWAFIWLCSSPFMQISTELTVAGHALQWESHCRQSQYVSMHRQPWRMFARSECLLVALCTCIARCFMLLWILVRLPVIKLITFFVRREINYVIAWALMCDRDWSKSRHVTCGRIFCYRDVRLA